jgi:DNA-binding NtrC family response regulator
VRCVTSPAPPLNLARFGAVDVAPSRASASANYRALANACTYAVRVGGARERVGLEHWPEATLETADTAAAGLHAETRALEERRLRETLERTRWNKSRAARALGLSRQGLLKKLRRYGLSPREAAYALDGPEGAA